MRDYRHVERYLNILQGDVYPQPSDAGHDGLAREIVHKWVSQLSNIKNALAVGCGQGNEIKFLKEFIPDVVGVTLGEDYQVCMSKNLETYNADMGFLPFDYDQFDLVYARHVLEHSPMPLLALMEWQRVSKQWLLLVVPDPRHFQVGGRNHYYVLTAEQWRVLLERAGWHPIWTEDNRGEPFEHRFMCEKVRQ